MKPAESAYNVVNSGCHSIANNIAAWNKLNAETLPALNKLLAGQNVPALPVAPAVAAAPACKP